MPWVLWFVLLGPGAFVVSTVLAATWPRWLVLQILVGVSAILVVWKIGEWAGAYDDENPEGCTDCGELYGFSVVAALANCVGWTVGTLLGSVIRFVIRR